MKTADFLFKLPQELIAQEPSIKRDMARLMVIDRVSGKLEDRHFIDILEYLRAEDILVLNDTRVIPARLWLELEDEARIIEVLLIRAYNDSSWICYVSPGKKARVGASLSHPSGLLKAKIIEVLAGGERVIEFEWPKNHNFLSLLEKVGKTPLPPYIHSDPDQWKEYYQTVYASKEGSVAAPTAGLHFTNDLLEKIKKKGTAIAYLTLHIGPGTFKPVKAENIEDHHMDQEYFELSSQTVQMINQCRKNGGRCIAVGTTVTRTLESMADQGELRAGSGNTSLFIKPGYRYQIVDCLITNFHLPGSTLIMLVSAFYSKEKVLEAYQQAIQKSYRFYSFGDAMVIF